MASRNGGFSQTVDSVWSHHGHKIGVVSYPDAAPPPIDFIYYIGSFLFL